MTQTWFDDVVEPEPDDAAGHLVLRLGAGRYAVPAVDVAEVLPVPPRTRVPGAPEWVAGVVNWRGHVLPVADLRPLLGVPASPLPTSARLVVVTLDEVEVGLLAESVVGLLDVPGAPEPSPGSLPPAAAALVVGVVDGGAAGPVAVLSGPALLALRPRARA